MKITCEHFDGKYPSFNVNLASKEGAAPFLTIKGCRIIDGSKGQFVSWPATKNEKTGKYWQHCYASEPFTAAVIEEARKGFTDTRTLAERRPKPPVVDEDVPW